MGLRDIGATLPPGFRFYPSDEELVCHYLYKKITNEEVLKGTLMEIDLHTCEPWQLPEVAKLNATEWYFFSFRDRKYATGFRTNRATTSGYWKATGKDRTVLDPMSREIVGMRKTLVFYRNRAPNGIKTGWIMHEFRLETPHMPPKEDWVLCRVFHKSKGMAPNLEDSNQLMFETTSCGPTSQTMPCGYNQITSFASTPSHHNQSSLLNLLQYSQGTDTNNEITSKGDDEYGFLWDMNLEEDSLGNGAPSNLEEMSRFEIDNGMVFL
ncbi:NAC domain-containing protein 21/22-like [Castanea sativa]|uniref:NAC domain-containing protein 21/22-like n=1 Tax=Castanea sativa TaxID=21020 RepID=UPI003F64ADF5